jgi:hypothetical protein
MSDAFQAIAERTYGAEGVRGLRGQAWAVWAEMTAGFFF